MPGTAGLLNHLAQLPPRRAATDTIMNNPLPLTLLCALFGAIIGSFLGVCAYRIPMGRYTPERDGIKVLDRTLSLTSPRRSICPQCEHQLAWWHNIPLLSWIILRGRCGFCQARIPLRYFVIELLSALLCVLCYWRFGPTAAAVIAYAFVCACLVITFIDIDYMIIPNVITYPGTLLGGILCGINHVAAQQGSPLLPPPFVQSFHEALLGLLAGPGVLLSLWWFYKVVRKREGLGLGDVKLLMMIGVLFGWEASWITIFAGSLVGSVIGVIQILGRRLGLAQPIPFGPYLVIGFLFFLFDGPLMISILLGAPHPTTSWWNTITRY